MPPPPDTLWVSASPGETRLALTGPDGIVELAVIRRGHAVGGVWLGRVVGVAAAGFAFVDIAQPRPGVLRGGRRREGEAVLVQARADPRGDKGARLTETLTLPGRWLVLSPGRPGLALSRRLAGPARERLAGALAPLLRDGEGVVVRAAAADADGAAIAEELRHLRGLWSRIADARDDAAPPAPLMAPDPIGRMAAEAPALRRVLVDDAAALAALKERFGPLAARDESFLPDLDDALAEALSPTVPLPSGGRLRIHETPAATLVDVDAGAGSAAAANAEAVPALARQMRLRNLSGHILLDAVPGRGGGGATARALARQLAADPVPSQVAGVTKLGLVELTRERRRASLAEVMLETQSIPSAESVALAALRALLRESRHRPTVAVLGVAPEVAAALAAMPEALADTARRLGRRPDITAESGRRRDDYEIR